MRDFSFDWRTIQNGVTKSAGSLMKVIVECEERGFTYIGQKSRIIDHFGLKLQINTHAIACLDYIHYSSHIKFVKHEQIVLTTRLHKICMKTIWINDV